MKQATSGQQREAMYHNQVNRHNPPPAQAPLAQADTGAVTSGPPGVSVRTAPIAPQELSVLSVYRRTPGGTRIANELRTSRAPDHIHHRYQLMADRYRRYQPGDNLLAYDVKREAFNLLTADEQDSFFGKLPEGPVRTDLWNNKLSSEQRVRLATKNPQLVPDLSDEEECTLWAEKDNTASSSSTQVQVVAADQPILPEVGVTPFTDKRSGKEITIDEVLKFFSDSLQELPGIRENKNLIKKYDGKDRKNMHYIVAALNALSAAEHAGTASSGKSNPNLRLFDTPGDFMKYVAQANAAWQGGDARTEHAIVDGFDDVHQVAFRMRFQNKDGERATTVACVDSGDYTNQIMEHFDFESVDHPENTITQGLLIAAKTQKNGHSCRTSSAANALEMHRHKEQFDAWDDLLLAGGTIPGTASSRDGNFHVVKDGMDILPIGFGLHLQDLSKRQAMVDKRGWQDTLINDTETLAMRDNRFKSGLNPQFSNSIYAEREAIYGQVVDYLTALKKDPNGVQRLVNDLDSACPIN